MTARSLSHKKNKSATMAAKYTHANTYNVSIQIRVQKVSKYDQEIPQPHTADQPTAPTGSATEHL